MSREVTLHASKKKGGASAKMAGKVRHVIVEPAKGGATTKTYRHPEAGQEAYNMPEPTPMIHTDPEAMGKHIVSELGDSFPAKSKGGSAARPATDAGKPADDDGDDDD